jgi:hypothetical protein
MFFIGATINRLRTAPQRTLASRRMSLSSKAFRPALELLEGRALPSAAPMSLLTPLVSVQVADAGPAVTVTITMPVAIVAQADHVEVIERVFQETFQLQPTAPSSPAVAMTPSVLPGQASVGQISALLSPQPTALTDIPLAAEATPAAAVASTTSAGTVAGTVATTGFGALPITQAVASAAPVTSFATTETTPTAALSSQAASASTATPLTSIGYFVGSDRTTDEEMNQELMLPADETPAPPDSAPANVQPERMLEAVPAPRTDATEETADPVQAVEHTTEEDGILSSEHSIALAAVWAGIGVSSVAVVTEGDTSRKRHRSARRNKTEAAGAE